MVEKGGSLAPRKALGRERKLDENGVKLLEEDLHARPAISYEKRAKFCRKLLGVKVSTSRSLVSEDRILRCFRA